MQKRRPAAKVPKNALEPTVQDSLGGIAQSATPYYGGYFFAQLSCKLLWRVPISTRQTSAAAHGSIGRLRLLCRWRGAFLLRSKPAGTAAQQQKSAIRAKWVAAKDWRVLIGTCHRSLHESCAKNNPRHKNKGFLNRRFKRSFGDFSPVRKVTRGPGPGRPRAEGQMCAAAVFSPQTCIFPPHLV